MHRRSSQFSDCINKLAACMGNQVLRLRFQGLWLLGTLPDTWETFRTSLSNFAPDGVITMELDKGGILNEETRRKSQGSSSQSDLKKENKKKNYNNQKNKHKKDNDGDDNTKVNTTIYEFFVCYDYDMVNLANDDSSWILDSGATCHVATLKRLLFILHTRYIGLVIGWAITGLSRIAGLLEEDGCHNSSGNGLWKVTLGSLIVAKGNRESKLYMTHLKISKSIVNVVDNDDMTEL
ncbi:hypothetical protein Tco_0945611 [Tanacetum coccineum]